MSKKTGGSLSESQKNGLKGDLGKTLSKKNESRVSGLMKILSSALTQK